MENSFSIIKKVKRKIPIKESLFLAIKNKALGKKYSLSVVFVSKEASKKLNFKYRNKNKPTDILSFPLDKNEGEIFINLDISKKKAEEFNRDLSNYLYFVFIHGLIHLKGMDHGSKMERTEKRIRSFFGV